ncbi:MAG: LysR family transcriptional regulator [Pseudomonadota bacterium]
MDWEDLKTAQEVAARRSVRGASQALGVHASTVTRRIERLEKAIGATLFERRPEGLTPSDAGQELFQVARRISSELNQVEQRLAGRDHQLSGSVVMTVAEPLAVSLFAPRLPCFAEEHPNLHLQIRVTYAREDLSRGKADVAVRLDNNPPETLVGKRLFAYYDAIYCSPGYLERFSVREKLINARWISWRIGHNDRPDWVSDTPYADVPGWGGFYDLSLQVTLAQAGQGFASLPCFVGDKTRGLVRVPNVPPQRGRDIWLLTHHDRRHTARVRAVMDFAETAIRSEAAAFRGTMS